LGDDWLNHPGYTVGRRFTPSLFRRAEMALFNLIGRLILSLLMLGVAIAWWPLTVLWLVIIGACGLADAGKYGPKNQFGYRPLLKRPIWQYNGFWYTTDGHEVSPGTIGPFDIREHARQFAENGQDFRADSRGVFCISY
jgi:hypothetical protein